MEKPDCSKAPNEKPTSSKGDQSPGNIIVTSEYFRPIDYVPVDETWQRSICNAFGWEFIAPSRGRAVNDLYRIPSKTPPKTPTRIRGDGNCWYRSIAHIATGDQENYVDVKNSVMEFMRANIDMLQKTFEDLPHYRRQYRYFFNTQFARNVIHFHSMPNQWARNVTMEMTAVMLQTRFYLYTSGGGWTCIDNGNYPVWSRRNEMTTYPRNVNSALIPNLSRHSMYINHLNRNHFETCHTGLNRI